MYEDKDENRNHEDNEQKLMETRLENMRKEYRKKEYVAVIIINIVFANFSYVLYTSVRKISTIKIYENASAAAIGWFLYGGCLYLALRHEKIEEQGRNRVILKAVIFGVFAAIAKIGLDFVTDWIGVTGGVIGRFKAIFIASGVENGLFWFFIIVILFAVIVRGKVHWTFDALGPILGMATVILFYISLWPYLDSETQLISLNVWFFAAFMVLLWLLLNTLYDQKESGKEKLSRGINVGIALGQIVLLGILISWLDKQEICLPVKFTYPYLVSIERGCASINAYLSEESEVEIPERIWWAKEIYIDEEVYSNLGTDITVHNIPDGVSVYELYHKESQCYFTIRGSEAYINDYVGDEKRVEIPEEVWGRKVTGISWGCFDESPVEEVIIPETVTVIKGAFRDCESLKQITLPSKLESIDSYAFVRSGIESIVLPESVKEVGECAFKNSKVKEIVGIENVEDIGAKAFWGTPWVESIEGDFVCIGDVLYLYKGDEEEVIIPSGIKEIRGAFMTDEECPYPRNVKKVFIPETVTTISKYSFEGQEGLEVYIPKTVTSLGSSFGDKRIDTIFGLEDKKSYRKGEPGCRNMIITTKDSPAVDYAIQNEQARFQIITEEEMEQEKERAISGRDEELGEEIIIQSEGSWINAYSNLLLNDSIVFDKYALIYKDKDSIPELVCNDIYAGYHIFSYSTVDNKIEYFSMMPYGTYAREYYYLPKGNHIVRASMGIDKKEHYEYYVIYNGLVRWREMDRVLLSELEENYINFNELHYYSKEEMLDKLYEYMGGNKEAKKEKEDWKVEGYDYLKKIDLVTTDGNAYPVMVPKDFVLEEEDCFVVYSGNGFSLTLYAGRLYSGLLGFMRDHDQFWCLLPDSRYVNIEDSGKIEEDGLIYQICTADRESYDGTYSPYAELIAAIPLGETDALAFTLRFDDYSCNSASVKYLEEIGKYYKIPVDQFIELIEEYT